MDSHHPQGYQVVSCSTIYGGLLFDFDLFFVLESLGFLGLFLLLCGV